MISEPNQWLTMFHQRNMDHYRRAATGDFPECTEVYDTSTKRHGQYRRFVCGITVLHCPAISKKCFLKHEQTR